jgi:hypothetical protein
MGGGFTLEPREGYLYVQLEPGYEINPENLSRLYSAMSESCRANGLTKTLTVGDGVTRNLTPVESTDFAWLMTRLLPGKAVACCFRDYAPDDQSQAFRARALTRGVRMEFFEDLNAALQWLGVRPTPKR